MTELLLSVYGVAIWSGDEEPYMMYLTGMFFHAVKNVNRFYGKMTGNQLPRHLL